MQRPDKVPSADKLGGKRKAQEEHSQTRRAGSEPQTEQACLDPVSTGHPRKATVYEMVGANLNID